MIDHNENKKTIRTTLMVTIVIALSKTFGFLREIVFASNFATGKQSDSYLISYSILSVLVLLFSAGISSTFVPIYTKTRLKFGERGANQYTTTILMLYIVLGIIASLLGYIAAPEFVKIFFSGKGNSDLIVKLVRIMFMTLVFSAVSGVLTSMLNARGKFIPEQLMGFALSLGIIFACIKFKSNIIAVAYAVAFAPIIQVVILMPFVLKNYKVATGLSFNHENVKTTFMLALPALVSMAFDEISNIVDTSVAHSLVEGAVTAVSYSYRLVTFALGVLVVPITTIMFSRLSSYAAKNNKAGIIDGIKKSTEFLAFIIFPVTAIACVLSTQAIAFIFQRGNFTAADTALVAPVFTMYMIGVFAFGLRNFQTRVFYALQDTKTPLFIGIFCVAVNITLDILLSKTMGVRGLTLATSIAGATGATLMYMFLRKKLGQMKIKGTALEVFKTFLSALACFGVTLFVRNSFEIKNNFLYLLVCAFAGLVAYVIFSTLFKVRSMNSVIDSFKSKIK